MSSGLINLKYLQTDLDIISCREKNEETIKDKNHLYFKEFLDD